MIHRFLLRLFHVTIWICCWRMNTLVTSQYQPRLSNITNIFSRRISQSDWNIQIKFNYNTVEGRTKIWQLKNLILTVWFNFQTYIIFSISLVSLIPLRSSGTDILYGCHLFLDVCIIYFIFLWLYNEFFIILYNILKFAELDCCHIISIYVPSTHA
jgi:hypothetical protein